MITKIHAGPMIGNSTPAIAGPITRLRLTCVELSEMAPARFRRPTRAGSTALHAGMFRALPMPTARTAPKSATRDGLLDQPTTRGQHQREHGLLELEGDQQAAPVEGVGDQATDERQQQQRAELGEGEQADEGAGAGQLVGVRAEHERLHPRADVRRERPDPHPPERLHGEGRTGRAGPVGWVGVALGQRFLGLGERRFGAAVEGHA